MRKLAVLLTLIGLIFGCVPGVQASTVEQYTTRKVYAVGTAAFASVATATDIFNIGGSATKTVKILKVELCGTQTTAGAVTFFLIKRSTASTAVSVAATKVPLDSANPAATVTNVGAFTANGTPGTTVGNVAVDTVWVPAAASVGALDKITLFDEPVYGQPVVLHGVAENLAINLNGVTVTGGSFTVNVMWVEE